MNFVELDGDTASEIHFFLFHHERSQEPAFQKMIDILAAFTNDTDVIVDPQSTDLVELIRQY